MERSRLTCQMAHLSYRSPLFHWPLILKPAMLTILQNLSHWKINRFHYKGKASLVSSFLNSLTKLYQQSPLLSSTRRLSRHTLSPSLSLRKTKWSLTSSLRPMALWLNRLTTKFSSKRGTHLAVLMSMNLIMHHYMLLVKMVLSPRYYQIQLKRSTEVRALFHSSTFNNTSLYTFSSPLNRASRWWRETSIWWGTHISTPWICPTFIIRIMN